MKITEATRFPHPVLSHSSKDYTDGRFEMSLDVLESTDHATVALEYSVVLDQPKLRRMVGSGQAALGVYVACQDTYFSQLIPLSLTNGSVTFQPGELSGRVTVRPVIWVRSAISGFALNDCHEEFGGGTAELDAGTILALDDEVLISVGRDKLAQIETIFSIAKTDALPPGTIGVNLENEVVQILVASDIHSTVNEMRGLSKGRQVILNSVYLPAIMQVLDMLRGGDAPYAEKRWYRIFTAKCDYFGIDTENPDLWGDAQTLLRTPFTKLHELHCKEGW